MKIKINTVLEKDIIKQLQAQATEQKRSINEIINEALMHYLQLSKTKRSDRKRALENLCSRPFKLSLKEINEILEEDYFEQRI